MSYILDNLHPGERILCKAKVHWMAFIYPIVMIAGMMMFGSFTGMATTELALTDKRVIGKIGISGGRHIDLPHNAVESVKVRQGLFGMLFDYGDIIITGDTGKKIRFRGLREPFDLQMQINEAVEMAVLGRKLSQSPIEKF